MLQAGNVRVIDTLNFLPMALAKFPKTFGIKELKKGHFPHFFNSLANWDYNGPLPDVEYYGADSMKEDDRASFLSWYQLESAAGKTFNLQSELVQYCESDVNIPAKGALKFRDIFLTVSLLFISILSNIIYCLLQETGVETVETGVFHHQPHHRFGL